MKGRPLALALLVYLTLDVANPFMPGALTFADGHLQVIDAGRPAGIDLPVLNAPGAAAPAPEALPPARPAVHAPAGAHRHRWIPARCLCPAAPDAAPASDDH
jgi:hypothetical protein